MSTVTTIEVERPASFYRERWVSRSQLARHFGFAVSWVDRRVAEGMPHLRTGGQTRFKISVVEAWFASRAEE